MRYPGDVMLRGPIAYGRESGGNRWLLTSNGGSRWLAELPDEDTARELAGVLNAALDLHRAWMDGGEAVGAAQAALASAVETLIG